MASVSLRAPLSSACIFNCSSSVSNQSSSYVSVLCLCAAAIVAILARIRGVTPVEFAPCIFCTSSHSFFEQACDVNSVSG